MMIRRLPRNFAELKVINYWWLWGWQQETSSKSHLQLVSYHSIKVYFCHDVELSFFMKSCLIKGKWNSICIFLLFLTFRATLHGNFDLVEVHQMSKPRYINNILFPFYPFLVSCSQLSAYFEVVIIMLPWHRHSTITTCFGAIKVFHFKL